MTFKNPELNNLFTKISNETRSQERELRPQFVYYPNPTMELTCRFCLCPEQHICLTSEYQSHLKYHEIASDMFNFEVLNSQNLNPKPQDFPIAYTRFA